MLLPVSRAAAQAEIPREVVEKTVLTEEDKQVIDKFVAQRLPDLSSSDPAAMKKSRDELIRPFRSPLVSVAFRQLFSDKVKEELKKNANAKDLIAVNALRIAGDVATSDSSTLLEQKLKDTSEVIRYAAVKGLERTMEAIATRNAAIPPNRVETLVAELGDVILDPKSTPDVMDAGVRALRQAMDVNRPGFSVRPLAIRTLTEAVGKLCLRNDAPVKVLLRADQFVREILTVNNPALELKGDSVIQAATMSGQLLSWAYCQIKNGQLPVGNPEARQEAGQVVRVAESSILLAGGKLGKAISPQKLGDDFDKATTESDRTFFQNLLKVVNPLNEPPFNIKAETFLQCKQGGGPG